MEIPDARTTSDQTVTTDTGTAVVKSFVDAINSSVGSKLKTASVDIAGKTGQDVINIITELRRKGHRVTQVGTVVTVAW